MEGIYERTGLCPYTNDCDSYRTIVKCESWIAKALSKLRREGKENLPESEGGFTEEGLQSKLAHMRQVKERCYSSYRRCLRFWQFEGREGREDKALNSLRQLKEDLPLYRISAKRY